MEEKTLKPIAVLGAGSWGTALALYLGRRGQVVNLWSVVKAEIDDMLRDKANNRYLPGHDLPDAIHPVSDLATAIKDVEDVLMVVPSVGFRSTLTQLKPLISPQTRIICATKGLDEETGQLLGEVVAEVLGKDRPFAVLSGPSFAREVAAGLPCSVIIASHNEKLRSELVQRFNSPIFHAQPSDDVSGVELGGVAKNVIAIATGICDGMEWGANARSAIITQGLAEIIRLGKASGGKQETFMGLSGLGDLILTCSDNQSRNRRLGLALGKGHNMEEAEKEIGQVVEGKRNAELVQQLAEKHGVHMPIAHTICKILRGELTAQTAMQTLFAQL